MKIKKEKFLRISAVFILLILIIIQLGKTKSLISQKKVLESAIKKQQFENSYLKNQFQNKLKSVKSKKNNSPLETGDEIITPYAGFPTSVNPIILPTVPPEVWGASPMTSSPTRSSFSSTS